MEKLNYYHVFKVFQKKKKNHYLQQFGCTAGQSHTSAAHFANFWVWTSQMNCTDNNLLLITTLAHTYFCVWFSVFIFHLSDLLAVCVAKSGEWAPLTVHRYVSMWTNFHVPNYAHYRTQCIIQLKVLPPKSSCLWPLNIQNVTSNASGPIIKTKHVCGAGGKSVCSAA